MPRIAISAGTIDASDRSAIAAQIDLLEPYDAFASLPLGLQQLFQDKALLGVIELQIGEP
jgi:hypothetical protein